MRLHYKPGQWNVICAVCGKKMKSGHTKRRWDGLYVCEHDWEPRHILDFIRAIPDNQTVPYSNPEPTDQFINVPYIQNTQAIAGLAISGLAVAGKVVPNT